MENAGLARGSSMDCSSNILGTLKAETTLQHLEMEARLDLLRPDFGLSDYVELLARFYGFYEPWEQVVFPSLAESAPRLVNGREKSQWLANDLRRLSVDPEQCPLCTTLPELATLGQILGSMYVIEGSTLGGQLLYRHWSKIAGLEHGLSFFRGYGEKTGSMWQLFAREIVRLAEQEEASEIVASAKATFTSLAAWLSTESICFEGAKAMANTSADSGIPR